MGLKDIFIFSKSLAMKSGWRLLTSHNLWTMKVTQKYIFPIPLKECIRRVDKPRENISSIWRVVVVSFELIGMVWHGKQGMYKKLN